MRQHLLLVLFAVFALGWDWPWSKHEVEVIEEEVENCIKATAPLNALLSPEEDVRDWCIETVKEDKRKNVGREQKEAKKKTIERRKHFRKACSQYLAKPCSDKEVDEFMLRQLDRLNR